MSESVPMLLAEVHPLYRGFRIRYEQTPIPAREFDWLAVDDEADGLVMGSGSTIEACMRDVDANLEESRDA